MTSGAVPSSVAHQLPAGAENDPDLARGLSLEWPNLPSHIRRRRPSADRVGPLTRSSRLAGRQQGLDGPARGLPKCPLRSAERLDVFQAAAASVCQSDPCGPEARGRGEDSPLRVGRLFRFISGWLRGAAATKCRLK